MKAYEERTHFGRVRRYHQLAHAALAAYGISNALLKFIRDSGNITFRVVPTGEIASFCTIWYADAARSAMIEPVATVPEHLRRGLPLPREYGASKNWAPRAPLSAVSSQGQMPCMLRFCPQPTTSSSSGSKGGETMTGGWLFPSPVPSLT